MGVLIIAEAGVNHNGDMKLAKRLIEEAKKAGADIVKFQTFVPEREVSKYAQKASYQKETTGEAGSQLEMIKKLQLSEENFIELKRYCEKLSIQFLSTPSDLESLEFLKELDMPFWKIPSNEITDLPYLIEIAKTNKPVILSTGMSTMEEIQQAVQVLNTNGSGEISLLHCTTEYPAPLEEVNLRAMNTLKEAFQCKVGYSDHTLGIHVPIAAAALGAVIIEKHFTLDSGMEGPDHRASLEPDQLKQMVEAIRKIEPALGDGIKRVTSSEAGNIIVARKSIVADKEIKKGETFTEENLTTKRPGNGISPMRWEEILGQKAKRDFQEDEMIEI
ncbi:N-acetylneuraminate synthase [Anaerosacchariphilus polymeriproducens]|uniref:N-acetylneuraminate synthase n=1 Tax=Anaerosacchariphilus polymeriproducens TaxID=1812858 RepID=A0A371AQL8_9FIRM|nr:N-acetylneuraminate synthase [Anaerosacchariphilus polymeriproducens]RDU21876.1 N-acetylneuraminate synthase [Anaerosacchariphilus polymeriproducens]